MEEKYNYHCESGKYKKVVINDRDEYCIIFNNVDSRHSFTTSIRMSNTVFINSPEMNIVLTDGAINRLYFALKKFLGDD